MIHPQPASILILLSESEKARRANGIEPVMGAPHRSLTLALLRRVARALRRRRLWRSFSRPSGIKPAPVTPPLAASGASKPTCDGVRLRNYVIGPIGASGTPGRADRGRSRR